jgi:anti-anti-sigma regulatory factor
MKIIREEKNGIMCVTVKGRMEAQLSPELERTIEAILKNGQTRLLFDLKAGWFYAA